jgi:hypothetical protein
MAERYGAETSVPGWRDRLVCSRFAGGAVLIRRTAPREIDMVITGTERRGRS